MGENEGLDNVLPSLSQSDSVRATEEGSIKYQMLAGRQIQHELKILWEIRCLNIGWMK
jgi:hypothetical protein